MNTLVYHLCPANPVRTFPPALGAKFIRLFLDSYPDWRVQVVGQNSRLSRTEPGNALDEQAILMQPFADEERVIDLVDKTACFTDLIPIVRDAGLVVCPDSSVGWLASAFPNVPVISLWGPFHPDDRVKYCRNHHPIMGSGCELAPCRTHLFQLPVDDCRKFYGGDATILGTRTEGGKETPQLGWCGALANIEPEAILEKAREILGGD